MHLRSDHNGYCNYCLSNVEHVRFVKSRFLSWLDRWLVGLPELFGFGPWYCTSCGKRRPLFPPYRRNATSYDPDHIGNDAVTESETEALGNIYFSTVSLVHRSNRARYYSEKFRDGIAERILTGAVSFSQVRESLDLTDLDLQDWLNRYLQSKLRRASLGLTYESSQQDESNGAPSFDDIPSYESLGTADRSGSSAS